MTIHIQPTAAVVRWYNEGSFEDRSKYYAICNLFYFDPTHVYVFGMQGELTKECMIKLFSKLQKEGVKKVSAERKNKMVTKDVDYLLNRALKNYK